MLKRHMVGVSLMGLGALVLMACGTSGGTSGGGGGPIKIGITGPFTGAYADPGIAIRNAGQMAVDEVNKAGGVNGRQLQVFAEDDACDAQQGTQAAQKLLTDGIVINIGGYCSGASIPESDVFHRSGDIRWHPLPASRPDCPTCTPA